MREGFESSSESWAGEGDIEHGDCNFGLGMSFKEKWARDVYVVKPCSHSWSVIYALMI